MICSILFWALIGPASPATMTYKDVGSTSLQMDVYSAPGDAVPCVIVIHGGAWIGGARGEMAALCRAIAAQGMTAVNVDYRLSPVTKWPAMIEDVQDAVRYVRDHAKELHVDPKRIGAAGASAGGHLALLLGTTDGWPDGKQKGRTSSKVVAVLNLFGPTDLTQDYPLAMASLLSEQVIGKSLVDAAGDIKEMSPVNHVTSDDAPVFTVQGKDDKTVPYVQAERLDKALAAKKIDHKTVIVDGMKHGIDLNNKGEVDAVRDGIAFLQRELTK